MRRRAAGRVTRTLRLLCAHGVISKVPHTSYYRVTSYGDQVMTSALRIRDLPTLAYAA